MNPTQAEQWRDIPGWEETYQVSDQGRVRSKDRTIHYRDGRTFKQKGKLLKPHTMKSGHQTVILQSQGAQRRELVHRLVLEVFVGPCPEHMEACHFNDNPSDNRLENLRWDSRAANNLDRVRNGIHPMSKKELCKRGHKFTPENTRWERNGTVRRCLLCERDRIKRRTAAEREYRKLNPLPPKPEVTHCKRGHEFTPENTYKYKNKPGKECKICRDERMRRWVEKHHPTN